MSPKTARGQLEQSSRQLSIGYLLLSLAGVFIILGKWKVKEGLSELETAREQRVDWEERARRLHGDLDRALEYIHSHQGDQDSPFDDPRGEPVASAGAPLAGEGSTAQPSALDSQGSGGDATKSSKGSTQEPTQSDQVKSQ